MNDNYKNKLIKVKITDYSDDRRLSRIARLTDGQIVFTMLNQNWLQFEAVCENCNQTIFCPFIVETDGLCGNCKTNKKQP